MKDLTVGPPPHLCPAFLVTGKYGDSVPGLNSHLGCTEHCR